ncbi:MAG: cytidylate kinase family protein [Acutalibacteraceae bacterium]
MEINTVITISREYGSGGRDIGKLVAEKLIFLIMIKKLQKLLQKSGLNNEVLRENDEIATTSIFGNFMAGSYFLQTKHIMQMN